MSYKKKRVAFHILKILCEYKGHSPLTLQEISNEISKQGVTNNKSVTNINLQNLVKLGFVNTVGPERTWDRAYVLCSWRDWEIRFTKILHQLDIVPTELENEPYVNDILNELFTDDEFLETYYDLANSLYDTSVTLMERQPTTLEVIDRHMKIHEKKEKSGVSSVGTHVKANTYCNGKLVRTRWLTRKQADREIAQAKEKGGIKK